MPAWKAEKWAVRLIQGATRSGMDIPANIVSQGMLAVAYYGVAAIASMSWADAEPLLDEMMSCVRIIRDPTRPDMAFETLPSDVEEVATILHLRSEVFKLHTNFSAHAAPLTQGSAAPKEREDLPSTPTSPRSSARPSPRKPPRL